MTQTFQTQIRKDFANKKIVVTRDFAAPIKEVWQAWTDTAILEKWWAPKPWRAETKKMDFKVGGYWLYAMVGPDGSRHWGKAAFKEIDAPNKYVAIDSFTDENGKEDASLPQTVFTTSFTSIPEGTQVIIELSFTSEEHMKKQIEMGFEQGFTMAHGQLDEYFLIG